jgi:cell division protein FtsI (penicillin-binding protein 3)
MSGAMKFNDMRGSRNGGAFSFDHYRGRLLAVLGVLAVATVGLIARAVQLQLVSQDFYEDQGNARFTRTEKLVAHRGAIFDRNGEPLAVSTPVDAVWVNPQLLEKSTDQYRRLAEAINRDVRWLTQRVSSNLDREFLYLVRGMRPDDAAQVKALKIPGVNLLREYRRYYPAGEVTGHVLGFTGIDDGGQEGLELAFDSLLAGEEGKKRVIRDLKGNIVEDIESISAARPGGDLVSSIDLRIQYLAYRELKSAIAQHHAQSGSVIVIDVETGEVLAMVNQPGFNPNDREQLDARNYKNRAATDIFEPGSSIKPFIVAAALETGRYHGNTVIDTAPGFIRVGIKTFTDEHNLGAAPLTTLLAKSSNVGMAKIALSLEPKKMWGMLNAFGFGAVSGSGFPAESAGMLENYARWRDINIATISHGNGIAVTPLQLGHAYAILGAGGVSRPISLRRVDAPIAGTRVLSESVAHELLSVMENVVSEEGTGSRAALLGYRVAGKTGTAWKPAQGGGYSGEHYIGTFGGVVPVSHPKLATIVMIDDPEGKTYHGGEVAAPVFANVMAGALRLLGIPADNIEKIPEERRDNTLLQASEAPAAPIVRTATRDMKPSIVRTQAQAR